MAKTRGGMTEMKSDLRHVNDVSHVSYFLLYSTLEFQKNENRLVWKLVDIIDIIDIIGVGAPA